MNVVQLFNPTIFRDNSLKSAVAVPYVQVLLATPLQLVHLFTGWGGLFRVR
jgi:hypothetical protein